MEGNSQEEAKHMEKREVFTCEILWLKGYMSFINKGGNVENFNYVGLGWNVEILKGFGEFQRNSIPTKRGISMELNSNSTQVT